MARENVPGTLNKLWCPFSLTRCRRNDLTLWLFMLTDIVTTESDPRKFLMVSDGNVLLAAEKLALYWKERSDFFGDRWLLPMTQVRMSEAQSGMMLSVG